MKEKNTQYLLVSVALLSLSGLAQADWFYRGTSNNWQALAMTDKSSNQYETCQLFANGDAGGGPRFKIDRYGNWQQSYPLQDYTVQANSLYKVTFDATHNTIDSTQVNVCPSNDTWYFRGTSNQWDKTAMVSANGLDYCSRQAFANGDSGGGPRFKIDHLGDWSESYPADNYPLATNRSYDICINKNTHQISAS